MKLNFFTWKPFDILHGVKPRVSQPILVFLHGMGGTGQIWRPIAAQLEEEFQCIAFDQRGHGGSRPVAADEAHHFHAMDYARDVIEMLDSLGIENCFLIGHSMGVRTALAIAKTIPARIDGVILALPAIGAVASAHH
jgi:pimeloyl-ACP methyl ester carboxylesterase